MKRKIIPLLFFLVAGILFPGCESSPVDSLIDTLTYYGVRLLPLLYILILILIIKALYQLAGYLKWKNWRARAEYVKATNEIGKQLKENVKTEN